MATAKKKPASIRPQKASQKPAARKLQSKKSARKALDRANACAGSHQPAKAAKPYIRCVNSAKKAKATKTYGAQKSAGSRRPFAR